MVHRRSALWAALAVAAPTAAAAQTSSEVINDPVVVGEITVIAPTPLQGYGIDPAKLPAVVDVLKAGAFQRAGSIVVTDALQQHVAGLSLSDPQGNAVTRDVNFRGFSASPLQGTPQGLAVYMGGVRLNEAFGDTVDWDLVPDIAVRQASIFTSNPAFGLNALGGAMTFRMKTGFDSGVAESLYTGVSAGPFGASVEGGAFGRVSGSAEYGQDRSLGGGAALAGLYLAAEAAHEDGWRRHSGSDVARLYGDLGWQSGGEEAHLVVAAASTSAGVVGPTPVDLLARDRRSVFTFPQTTRNEALLVALNGRKPLNVAWDLLGDLYVRDFTQHHLDGNGGDFAGCADEFAGALCLDGSAFPDALRPPAAAFQVQDLQGRPIPCPPGLACDEVPYGTLDRTRTASTGWGGSLQLNRGETLLGHGNYFAVGASFDAARSQFTATSELAVIRPDLLVAPDAALPGQGETIRTAGDLAYSPVGVRSETRYLGLYATDTFDLTKRLSLTLSGRFNDAVVQLADLTGSAPGIAGRHRFDRFNPAAGLAYALTDEVSLYGGYAEANRAPTPLELACSDPLKPCLLENAVVSDPPLKQVVARSWEAGVRGGGVRDRLQWRLGVFRTDNDDDILALASVVQGRGSFANVGKTRRQGVEASVNLQGRTWSAYAGYSWIEATYRFAGALPSPNIPFADAAGDIHVSPGDRLGGMPGQRFKAGGDLAVTPQITVGGDLIGVGSQYLSGDEANQDRKLPAYWTASVHAAWKLARGVELEGRIDNLFDRRYASFGTYFQTDALANVVPSPLPPNPDPRMITPAPPRSFVVRLRARW